jgi:photosystem II stability/assembly factor-like uncharacterized protein
MLRQYPSSKFSQFLARVLSFFVFLSFVAQAKAQWQPMNGPYAPSNIAAIAGSPTFCIASLDNGGIYSSTDGGVHWQLVDSIAPIAPLTFLLDGTTVFAGTRHGVYVSNDSGKNWAHENQGLPDTAVNQLALNRDTVYAATVFGLFSTSDKNFSWSIVDAGLPVSNWTVQAIAVSDSEYCTSVYNVIYLTDRKVKGANARPVAKNIAGVNALEFVAGSLIAAASNGYVSRSTDNGATWTPGAGLYLGPDLFRMSAAGNTLTGALRNLIYRSSDNGSSWNIIDTLLRNSNTKAQISANQDQEENIVVAGGAIYAGTGYGVYRSLDQGNSWLPMNNGLQESIIYELANIDGSLFASTQNTIYKFSQTDAKWEICTEGVPGVAQTRLVSLGSDIFMLSASAVYRSIDTGNHWEPFNNNLPVTQSPLMATMGSDLVAALGWNSKAIYFSADTGKSWDQMSGTLPPHNNLAGIVGFHTLLFAGLSDSGLYRSRDTGKTWQPVNEGIWNDNDPYILIEALAIVDSILCIETQNGVFMSTDFGNHWFASDTGAARVGISCFTDDSGKIVAASGGVLSFDPRSLIVRSLSPHSLSNSLDACYPNPMSDRSLIEFTLKNTSRTRLTLVDELGREAVTLVDGELNAGKHTATLNAHALPNGVYLCRLAANGKTATTKLVVRH